MKLSQRGFTILEIVVVIAIFTAVLSGMLALFNSHNKIYNYESALTQATGDARSIMNEFSVYALQATRVLASQTINGTAYTSGTSTVIFQLPAFNSSGTALANTYDYVAFSLSGSTLTENLQAASGSSRTTATKTLSTSATMTLSYDSGTWTSVQKVTIALTTTQTSKGETITQQANETFKLRNY